jgi:hypothetical protein
VQMVCLDELVGDDDVLRPTAPDFVDRLQGDGRVWSERGRRGERGCSDEEHRIYLRRFGQSGAPPLSERRPSPIGSGSCRRLRTSAGCEISTATLRASGTPTLQ